MARTIHRFINGGIKLIAADVSGGLSESIQSASQTFRAQTPLIARWCWMGTKGHHANLFVVPQVATE